MLVHVHIYIGMCVQYMHVCMLAFMYVRLDRFVHVCMYIHCMYMHVCKLTCMHAMATQWLNTTKTRVANILYGYHGNTGTDFTIGTNRTRVQKYDTVAVVTT